MSNPLLMVLGGLFILIAGYLVYSGSLNLFAGLALLAFAVCVAGMIKLAGSFDSAKGKAVVGALFALAMCFMGLFIWQSHAFQEPQWQGPDLKLDAYETARATVFANKLLDLAPQNPKALLITGSEFIEILPRPPGAKKPEPPKPGEKKKPEPPPQVASKEYERISQLQLAEVKRVFGNSITIAAEEKFPAIITRDRLKIPHVNMNWSVKGKDFEAVIKNHSDCNMVVSLIGLPGDTRSMTIWRWNAIARPKLAFLYGNPRAMAMLSGRDLILLYTAYKNGWTYVPNAPSDPEQAFAQRYDLIGSGAKAYPVPDPDKKRKAPADAQAPAAPQGQPPKPQ